MTNVPPRNQALEATLSRSAGGLTIGRACLAFDSLPSTMDLAHQLAVDGAEEGTCVWAETQTAGRGRAGRAWVSPPGGCYLSLILRPTRILREVPQLALVAGLAAAQAIHDLTKLSAVIRWPNDLMLRGRKLAGVLCEAKSNDNKVAAIIGIGINVSAEPHQVPAEGTSLAQSVTPPDRVALFGALCRRLQALYDQWNRDGFAPLKPLLVSSMTFGNIVRIDAGSDTLHGQTQDIDDQGRLVIRLDSGIMRAVDVGEVTLLR
jgi:BirA family biotin operon repressor/biotin-[acetyl-CoA-carboxylase] ligase